ncbi:unnamed protein product, partial [Didymodactylos carnosus]
MEKTSGNDGETDRTFRYSDVVNEPTRMLVPIKGYQSMRLLSLEDTMQPIKHLIDDIDNYVYIAKRSCKNPQDDLTQDESAAIHLYTMNWTPRIRCLYYVLNQTLRTENRELVKPWFAYLKLLLTALYRLPSVPRTIWRGIRIDLSMRFVGEEDVTWWGFSSCTETPKVLEETFLGKEGIRTLFEIECLHGK